MAAENGIIKVVATNKCAGAVIRINSQKHIIWVRHFESDHQDLEISKEELLDGTATFEAGVAFGFLPQTRFTPKQRLMVVVDSILEFYQ